MRGNWFRCRWEINRNGVLPWLSFTDVYLIVAVSVTYSIQFNTLFETQCFYTLSVHSDNAYNKNILITMKDNRTNNYIIMLIFTKIVKELDSVIVIVDIQ